jgi:Pyruvate/2-oxoacid:ferredoxin oxidoreductase delta subunit
VAAVQYSTVQTVQYSTHLHTNRIQNDKKQSIYRTTQKTIIEQHRKTIHRTTQKQYIEQPKNKLEQCGPCPVLVIYALAFALQLREKHGKTSVSFAYGISRAPRT